MRLPLPRASSRRRGGLRPTTPRPTKPGPTKLRPTTLRSRLLLGTTALLVAVGLVIGVVTTFALRHQLMKQVEDQVTEAVQRSQRPSGTGSGSGPGGGGQRPPAGSFENVCGSSSNLPGFVGPGQVDGLLNARFLDGSLVSSESGVINTTDDSAQDCFDALSDAQVDAVSDLQTGQHTVDVPGLGSYLVRTTTLTSGAVQVTGLPLNDVNSTLWKVAGVEAAVILLGIAGAALVGDLLIRRDLAPLRRVATTASRVAELELDRGAVDLSYRVPAGDADERTEVGKVALALNRMLDHVGSALEARHESEQQVRQFVADASHELRTPLAAIRGYSELTRRSSEAVPADVLHAMARVESEAVRMTGLVEDLLLLARLDSGRALDREPVDLTMTVLDAVSDAQVAGRDHTWRLDLPEEAVEVIGDPGRLHQVLTNLLANARTHTPPGTTVTVAITPAGATTHLDVVDDGPGIPPEILPHVFERFARGDSSRSRAAGSTGLGLAIVQAVVTSHHGSVRVESSPGRTVFRVTLPTM